MDGENEILEKYARGIFRPGDLVSVTSHAGVGKTVLMLELANNRCHYKEIVLWFDMSHSLMKNHLCKDVIVARGVISLKEITKIASVLKPNILIIDDVSKIKSIELGKNANLLKRMCYRINTTAFLIHQIRNKPQAGHTYFHNLPVRLDKHINTKAYLERYKLTSPTVNLVLLVSKRKEEKRRKILIPIGVDGMIHESVTLNYMVDIHHLIPPQYKINKDKRTEYIENNRETLKILVIEKLQELIARNELEKKEILTWKIT